MTESKTILIADDDRALVGALRLRCRRLGIHVITAHDTLSTISRIRETAPDIVCLDRHMPGGDALSVCEMVALDGQSEHASPVQQRIPMIVLTGQTDQATIRTCGELDVHFVAKDGDPWGSVGPLIRQLLDLEPAEESRGATVADMPCTTGMLS